MGYKDYLNVYEFECELPGNKQVVKFKPITTNQIKKLLVYEREQNPIVIEKAFDELIQSCVVSEDFKVDDIYTKDRDFLLIELRKASKGEQYEFQFNCPECKSDNLSYIDFRSFNIESRKESYDDNVIEITKDVSISIDHILRKEQKEAYKAVPRNTKKEVIPSLMALYTLAAGIKSITTPSGVEENLSFEDKFYIMDTLTFNIVDKIKEWYVKNTFGYDMAYKVQCVHCDYESNDQTLEVGSNFF